MNMTLEKILQSQGFGSRKLCRGLIEGGRVKVGDAVCTDADRQFEPEGLSFAVDGETWLYRRHVYLAMNKPAGMECSHRPQHHESVFSLLPPQLVQRGVQCVGRLDQDTTGLLLLSDDGAFIHAYSSPKRKVPKLYEARVRHAIGPEQIEALRAGVQLHGEREPTAALACRQTGEYALELILAEGKYHQVKRMIAAAGNRVEKLHRRAIGGLELDDSLPEGRWRWLDAGDLMRLRRDGQDAGD